jgi:hypothetical protein
MRAAACEPFKIGSVSGLVGSTSRAMTRAAGISSWASSRRLGPTSTFNWVAPVTLPPGRLRLATSPSYTGSPSVANTIGMELVAALAASAPGVVVAARTLTRDRDHVGVGFQMLEGSSFDPAEVDVALSLLDLRRRYFGDGVIALDCGANIGVHTIEWAKRMNGWGEVIAIEAQELRTCGKPRVISAHGDPDSVAGLRGLELTNVVLRKSLKSRANSPGLTRTFWDLRPFSRELQQYYRNDICRFESSQPRQGVGLDRLTCESTAKARGHRGISSDRATALRIRGLILVRVRSPLRPLPARRR